MLLSSVLRFLVLIHYLSSSLAEVAAERTREWDSENVTGKHAACFLLDARILRYELSKVN
jgi:hypothetical protein